MPDAAAPERIPVIVGVGEAIDRPADLNSALEPLSLMHAAALKADADAGAKGFLADADSLDIVHLASWRYLDVEGKLAALCGMTPRHEAYGEVGGETPVRMIHDAARRIAHGESRIAVIDSGEAQNSNTKARAQNVTLPWTPFEKQGPKGLRGSEMVHPLAAELGASAPITIYPFYDCAAAAAYGQTPAEALAESGEIWAKYAAVAATNPIAWSRKPITAAEITTPTPQNRLIAHPYTKLMVANPQVNQAACVIVTSLAVARERGVPEDRIIYIAGGAEAHEPDDFLARDQYVHSHAQDAVLSVAMSLAPGGRFDALELYSCFPCVPKMARRTLGLGRDVEPTVTGGHTFFGGPLNAYMLHGACAMAHRLRSHGGVGLLYGQGGFVTDHHALVVSKAPTGPLSGVYSVQQQCDARYGAIPEMIAPQAGPAVLESSTVLYARDGSVLHGIAILRVGAARTVAAVAADDHPTLAILRDADRTPVGRSGQIASGANGRMEWRVSA